MAITFSLSDDGTMDTVVECYCDKCERTREERFDGEYAAEYRDPDSGELDEGAFFAEIAEEVYCDCEE
jgi:hypothetical protein